MHKLTEKLLATGVIPDQTVKLLKLWNSTFQELPDDIKQAKTQDELLRLVDEMAEIIEQEEEVPELRETEFDLGATFADPHHVNVEVDVGGRQRLFLDCILGKTVDGKYVHAVPSVARQTDALIATRGNIITERSIRHMIMSVEPRYVDDQLKYYVLTVEEMHA
jgi:hypothetical protein